MKNISTENQNYQALYRKYRPQTFKEVIGQDNAIKFLENSIKENKVHHAYIFSGDRGVGKTTMARIFAKELGTNLEDIYEINAASSTGIDNIREIEENLNTTSFSSKYKIYILDEAHMLSKAAFNALLKTLEEPPKNVIFILATTEKEKLLPTILSRCHNINFLSPNLNDLSKMVKNICEKEGIKIDEESILEISKAGNGSFRDTTQVLEKVINSLEKKDISISDTKNILGDEKKDIIFDLIKNISQKDILKIWNILENNNFKENHLMEKFYLSFTNFFENLLLIRLLKIEEVKKIFENKIGEEEIKEYKAFVDLNPKFISASILAKILEIDGSIKTSQNLKKNIFLNKIIEILDLF